jgi:hypothetical protein
MKKIRRSLKPAGGSTTRVKPQRENVWCERYGYFIDLDACRARSLQNKACRRCFPSLIQVPLPF